MWNRRGAQSVMAAGWLVGSASTGLAASPAPPRLPNIICILADDLGYGDIHALNPQRGKIPTPHLDKFVSQGMSFTAAYAPAAVCTPSRYGILTGRYAWRSRLQMGVFHGLRDSPLIASDRLTVAALLKKHGYQTAGFGKWHLGWDVPIKDNQVQTALPVSNGPATRGFDRYWCNDVRYFPPFMFTVNERFSGTPLRHWNDVHNPPPEPLTDADFEDVLPRTIDAAIQLLDCQTPASRPFFAYVAPMAPHTPLAVAPAWQDRSGLGRYGDYVMELDAEIGRLLTAVERAGHAADTLIIVTSDNGCSPAADIQALQAKGHYPAAESRGCKADLWDGGHRVPFIVRWPGKVTPGTICKQPVCLTDMLATCAGLVGEKLPDNAGEDSVSLLPLLEGRPGPARDSLIHHSMLGKFAIRQDRWKLLLCAGSGCGSAPDDSLAERQGLPKQQLYDMVADPGEKTNLQADHPEIVAKLTRLLESQVAAGRSTPGKPQQNDVVIDLWKRLDESHSP